MCKLYYKKIVCMENFDVLEIYIIYERGYKLYM